MKVTVVTVAFNAADTIVNTLRSVRAQSYPDLEHLIIDGGSHDDTAQRVREEGQRVATFISEPDQGLYDAMNKGLSLATGQIIAFLNADDWYASPNVLNQAARAFADDVDLVYGNLDFVEAAPPHRIRRIWRDAPRGREAFLWGWSPAHPATFMRTQLLRRVGGFDTRLRLGADYAMLARCFLVERARGRYVPHVLTNMRIGGLSTSGWRSIVRNNGECFGALRELGAPLPALTIGLKVTRKILQVRPAPSGQPDWLP